MVRTQAQTVPKPAAPAAPAAEGAPPETALATKSDKLTTFRDFFERYRPQLAAVLGKNMPVSRLINVTMASIGRNDGIQRCTPVSVVRSVMVAAQVGLDPSGVLGSAYLVPYWNDRIKAFEAQLIIGYRGMLDLARRAGEVVHAEARTVYQNDRFEYMLGTSPNLVHVPSLDTDPGPPIAAYAVITLRNSDKPLIEIMSRTEIERIRARSKAKESGPWVTDWDMMARKTALRRVIRYAPMSPEAAQAVTAEERMEAGEDLAEIIPLPDVGESAALPTNKSEALAQRIREAHPAAVPAEEPTPSATQGDEDAPPEGTWLKSLEVLLARAAPLPQTRPSVLQAVTSFQHDDGKQFEGFRSLEDIAQATNAERIAQIAYLKLRRTMAASAEQQALV